MRLDVVSLGFLTCVALGAGVAAAQPAPIVYAGQGGQQATTVSTAAIGLAGGDDNSYGYGRERSRTRGAVIDIRRSGDGSRAAENSQQRQRVAEQAAAQPPLQAEEGARARPDWLQQERVGPPYEANGRWYVPTPEPGYEQTGQASWYGPTFHGQQTASGEVFDQEGLTAAHPTLPIPSLVQVTNLENGREVIVRVNDRGPFVGERLIDMSHGAAVALGFENQGQARVHVRYLGPAPRRVNADGSSAPAMATVAPVMAQANRATEQGPRILVPEDEPQDEPVMAQAPTVQMTNLPAVSSSSASATGAYFVQIGAYSDLTNAHRVRAAVESAGPVAVDIRETANGELFRVRVGPWNSRTEADAARLRLADLGYGEAVIASR